MSIKWFAKLSITFIYSKFHDLFCKILTELISCDIAKVVTEGQGKSFLWSFLLEICIKFAIFENKST